MPLVPFSLWRFHCNMVLKFQRQVAPVNYHGLAEYLSILIIRQLKAFSTQTDKHEESVLLMHSNVHPWPAIREVRIESPLHRIQVMSAPIERSGDRNYTAPPSCQMPQGDQRETRREANLGRIPCTVPADKPDMGLGSRTL